jgi:hypothetical protein
MLITPAPADPVPLNQEEVTALYAEGYELQHRDRWKVVIRPDGTMSFLGNIEDTGNWSIEDNIVCSKWRKLRSGAERCGVFYQDGDVLTWEYQDGNRDYGEIVR